MFDGKCIFKFWRNFSAAIFVAFMLAILPTHSVFANEEADKHYNQGETFFEAKNWDGAIAEFQAAIAIDPNNATYYNDLGRAYNRSKRYEDAVKSYGEAIRLAPNNAVYYNNLGWTYLNWEKYAPAEENFKKSIEKHTGKTSLYC